MVTDYNVSNEVNLAINHLRKEANNDVLCVKINLEKRYVEEQEAHKAPSVMSRHRKCDLGLQNDDQDLGKTAEDYSVHEMNFVHKCLHLSFFLSFISPQRTRLHLRQELCGALWV